MPRTIRSAALVLAAFLVLSGCRADRPPPPDKRWPVFAEAGSVQPEVLAQGRARVLRAERAALLQ